MRNLKKILALVLALMMTLSLMVTASATSFNDVADDSAYGVAVDLMSEIGVFNGTGAGKFNPDGTLKRDAAAKIITYMKLGPTLADSLPKDIAPFSDVKAGNWAAGAITYCYNEGIVAGVGGGNYSPNREVKGYEFAKMVLVAIGSEKSYTGGNWQFDVALDAKAYGLLDGMQVTLSEPLTRAQACQMAFNGLYYTESGVATGKFVINFISEPSGNSIAALDGEVCASRTEALLLVNAVNSSAVLGTNFSIDPEYDVTGSLADTVFGLAAPDAGTDDFGRPTTVYADKDGNTVVEVVQDATLTFDGVMTYSALYNALGLSADADVTPMVDGLSGSSITIDKATTNQYVGAMGATTHVYKSGSTVSIYTVTNYLAKVTAVQEYVPATATAAATPASVTVEAYGLNASNAKLAGLTCETSGYTVGQYVVVTVKKDNATATTASVIESIEAAQTVEGVQTAYSAATTTVDGKVYSFAANYGANNDMYVAPADVGFAATYTYYVKDGVVLGAAQKTAAIPTDYVYITKTQAKAASSDLLTSSENKVVADAIFPDGTHKVIELAVYKDDTGYKYVKPTGGSDANTPGTVAATAISDDASPVTVNDWFAYTVKDGVYTLAALNTTYANVTASSSGFTLTKGETTSQDSKYTNSATNVVSIDTSYDRNSFTGLPTATSTLSGRVLYTYAPNSNIIASVVAVGQAASASSSVTYAYAVKQGNTVSTGNEWVFAINGSLSTYVISGSNAPTAGSVYTLTSSTDGTYTVESTAAADTTSGQAQVTVADTTFYVAGGSTVYYASKYAVYNVSSAAGTIGETDIVEKDDYVVAIKDSNGAAVVVYIVDAP